MADTKPAPQPKPADPQEVAKILGEVAARSSTLLQEWAQKAANKDIGYKDEFGIAQAPSWTVVEDAGEPAAARRRCR